MSPYILGYSKWIPALQGDLSSSRCMGIWIELEIEVLKGTRPGAKLRGAGLANTGYIAPAPELGLPLKLGRELGIWPGLRSEALVLRGYGLGGIKLKILSVPSSIRVRALVQDRVTEHLICNATLISGENRLLMSDQLLGGLGIDLYDPARGLWRFRDDPPDKLRRSAQPQYW